MKKGNNPSVVGLYLMLYRHLVAAVSMFGCISQLRKHRATFLSMISSNRERESKDRERLTVVQLAHRERGEVEGKIIFVVERGLYCRNYCATGNRTLDRSPCATTNAHFDVELLPH